MTMRSTFDAAILLYNLTLAILMKEAGLDSVNAALGLVTHPHVRRVRFGQTSDPRERFDDYRRAGYRAGIVLEEGGQQRIDYLESLINRMTKGLPKVDNEASDARGGRAKEPERVALYAVVK